MTRMILDRKRYEDKVRACWVGKNIGGTMGGPFEHRQAMQGQVLQYRKAILRFSISVSCSSSFISIVIIKSSLQ